MNEPVVSISILAGGQSSRMGQPKSFVQLAGKSLIDHLLERIQLLQYPIQIIANDLNAYETFGFPVFPDIHTGKGALGGIYTALTYSPTLYTLCLACDMPFINTNLISHLVSQTTDYDAVVPIVNDYPEGLHTIYHQRCKVKIEQQIYQDSLQLGQLFHLLNVRFIPETTLRRFDPNLHAFINLNTPQELEHAEAIYHAAQEKREE